jgi:hypothetical protein
MFKGNKVTAFISMIDIKVGDEIVMGACDFEEEK